MSDAPTQRASTHGDDAFLADADGGPLPRWRERGPAAVLLLAVLLQLYAWSRLEGYQIADSVENMERALSLARGEAQDPSSPVRSIGF
jgi:hypothetical protein